MDREEEIKRTGFFKIQKNQSQRFARFWLIVFAELFIVDSCLIKGNLPFAHLEEF